MADEHEAHHPNVQFVQMDDTNVMASAIAPTGQTITLITAPAPSIEGQDGPVLIPTVGGDMLVVYSEEYVDSIALNSEGDHSAIVQAMARILYEGVGVGIDHINATR